MEDQLPQDEAPTLRDIAPAIEFSCWVVVALAPFLRWVNGAAVTRDQFVIQIALTSLALAAALGLRCWSYVLHRRERRSCRAQSHLE